MTDEDRKFVEAAFAHWARSGYDARFLLAELDERVEDLVGPTPDAFRDGLRAQVERDLEAQRALEASWTEPTANDDLEEAFAELDDSGVVALENAGYSEEEGAEDCDDAAAERDDARGAVFFTAQEVERGVRGEGLRLSIRAYGDADVGDIAREVRDVLAKYGIATTGEGAAVVLTPFEWRKRAFTEV
jgi:hypothetical protein